MRLSHGTGVVQRAILGAVNAQTRRAQTTVEYMLTLSVVTIAVIAALLTFSDVIQVNTRSVSSFLADELSGQDDGTDQVQ